MLLRRTVQVLLAALLATLLSPLSATASDPPVVTPTADMGAAPEVPLTTAGGTYSLVVGADDPVWFMFEATRDAIVFATLDAGGGTVYEQGAGGLEPAGSLYPPDSRPMTIQVEAGRTYFAEVVEDPYGSGATWPDSGRAVLTLADVSPPNDTRAQAIPLPTSPATSSEEWLGWALSSEGDPSCAGTSDTATMWYRFTAPTSGVLTTKVAASPGLSISHGIYTTGKRNALRQVACHRDRGELDPAVTTKVKAGQTYYVMVEGHRIPTEFTASSYNYSVTVDSSFARGRR